MRKYKGKTIRRKADGRWWVRYTVQGKVHAVYGKTQNECLQKLKDALKQLEQGNVARKPLTLGEWLQRWLELYKVPKVKKHTLADMQRCLTAVKPIHNWKLIKITSLQLQEWLNSIDKPRKREKLQIFLKDAFTKAWKNRLIEHNPFDAIESIPRQRKQSRSLTHEEENSFVEACQNYNQGDLYLLCLYQGLRLGEAVALTWQDIDFAKGTISISKAIDGLGELTTPKTATSNRIIPLFARSRQLLLAKDKANGSSGNIFSYNRKVYQNAMLKLTKQLCLHGVSVHTLRHTFATRCSEAGIPPKVVQKWLGHSTVEMTLNVYTHVNNDYEKEMTSKFDTFFDTF